jgi:hypothetical protein
MDLFSLMNTEACALQSQLSRCLTAWESSRMTHQDRQAVAAVCRYLRAQERAVFVALIAVSPDDAQAPVDRHHRMKHQARQALALCRRHDPAAPGAVRALATALDDYAGWQRGALRQGLQVVFTPDECAQIAGTLKLELLDDMPDADAAPTPQVWRAWCAHWIRRRRTLPRLTQAQFVYRN